MIVCLSLVASILMMVIQADGLPSTIPIKKAPYEILVVQRFDKTKVIGTGAILNEQWVVTTASSVNKYRIEPHSLMIRSGSGVYNQGGGLHEVDKIIIHPDFQAASLNHHWGKGDVALLKIFFRFHLSLTVAPVPTALHVTAENTTTHIVGWPLTNGKHTKALKVATTNIENWEKCRMSYSSELSLDYRTLCTQKSNMKVQEGSSLIYQAQLIGLYKTFNSLNIEPKMDVYIDIASYNFWIDKIIAG